MCQGLCGTLGVPRWPDAPPSLRIFGHLERTADSLYWGTRISRDGSICPIPGEGRRNDWAPLALGFAICQVPRVIAIHEAPGWRDWADFVSMSRWNELSECHPCKWAPWAASSSFYRGYDMLDYFSGKCPQGEFKATWGHLFHCLRIMPYFSRNQKNNTTKRPPPPSKRSAKWVITFSPKFDSSFLFYF